MDSALRQRAIEFFKKENNTDQITEPIINLMVMFANSENNSELELSNQDLLDSNIKLNEDLISHENKIDELNQSLDEANAGICMLEDIINKKEYIIKQKELDADKINKSCEEINIATLKLVEDYNNLMDKFKESQTLLKDFFKSDLPENLN